MLSLKREMRHNDGDVFHNSLAGKCNDKSYGLSWNPLMNIMSLLTLFKEEHLRLSWAINITTHSSKSRKFCVFVTLSVEHNYSDFRKLADKYMRLSNSTLGSKASWALQTKKRKHIFFVKVRQNLSDHKLCHSIFWERSFFFKQEGKKLSEWFALSHNGCGWSCASSDLLAAGLLPSTLSPLIFSQSSERLLPACELSKYPWNQTPPHALLWSKTYR